jgi:hypothetical protein
MATEKIVFETEVKTGNSGSSVKGLKQELRELTKQLGSLEEGSEAFNNAAKRAGALKEQIRGINDAIDDADPEKKFGPFSRTVQGLAGGFAAAQGAMALFGSESEDLEKTLVRVQGAMALSQGINSLLEFKNDFKELGGIIVKNVVKAFTTLRGAMIATGIGALVVTLGTLIANWKEFSKAITDAFPSFKVVTDFFNNIRQIGVGALKGLVEGFKVVGDVVAKLFEGDFSGAIDSAKEFGARVAVAYNEGFAEEDRKIKIENGLKDRKFALDLEEAKGNDIRAKRIKLMQDELSILEKGSEEYNAKLIEIETARTELRKEAAEKEKARLAYQQIEEERAEEIYQKKQKDKEQKVIDDKIALEKKLRVDIPKRFSQEEINVYRNSSETKRQIDLVEQNAKLDQIKTISGALSGFAALAGEQTAAGKAIAVAQTTIDTYVAAQKAYTSQLVPGDPSSPIRGIFFAAAAVASGIANVRRILSVQVPGGGGGGSVPSAGGQSVPQFNPAVAQQVQGGGDITLGQKPQRVYVVESDIRGTMNKVDVIEANATIG